MLEHYEVERLFINTKIKYIIKFNRGTALKPFQNIDCIDIL